MGVVLIVLSCDRFRVVMLKVLLDWQGFSNLVCCSEELISIIYMSFLILEFFSQRPVRVTIYLLLKPMK